MENSDFMRRSASMPIKPEGLQAQRLKRSAEHETLYSEDYEWMRGESLADLEKDSSEDLNNKSQFNCKTTGRVVKRNGRGNVTYRRIPQRLRYLKDFVTTLIELDWKYMLTIFVASYFLTWCLFGGLCYMAAYSHGDMFFDEVTGERLGEGRMPCIVGVYDFLSILVYSIETQTTIGFGEKYPTEECPEIVFLFIVQIICSIFIEGAMVSIIYVKTARPAKQMTKLKFSDKAVICYRDDELCLLFRVCDLRQQQTIDSKIRVYTVVDKTTCEGETLKINTELKLVNNGQQIIIWPEIICHVIDSSSPLAFLRSANDLNSAQFELLVSIVGTSAATAQITEARMSYLPTEIYWGQRFMNIIQYDAQNHRHVIDYSNFNATISVDM